MWHKHLERSFLVDLGSSERTSSTFLSTLPPPAHGTYIGNFRIESNKPVQLPVDSTFRFGDSTRKYVMRERPQHKPIMDELEKTGGGGEGREQGEWCARH